MNDLVRAAGLTSWAERGRCWRHRDPDVFFRDGRRSEQAAKRVCSGCPVRPDCLEHALVHNEPHGVWGGLTAAERRRARRLVQGA